MRAARETENHQSEENDEKNFVELRWMTTHAITKVNSPGNSGGHAGSMILNSRKKTSDAPNGNACAQRQSKKIAGARGDAEPFFRPLHRDGATDQSTDDCFS